MSVAVSPSFSLSRIAAMVMRHWYLLRSSWPRLLELVYWPLVQMVMWGFLQSFMAKQTGTLATGGRHLPRGGIAVGHSVSRSARVFVFVSRRNVVAQSCEPHDLAAPADRIRALDDRDEPDPARRSASCR